MKPSFHQFPIDAALEINFEGHPIRLQIVSGDEKIIITALEGTQIIQMMTLAPMEIKQ